MVTIPLLAALLAWSLWDVTWRELPWYVIVPLGWLLVLSTLAAGQVLSLTGALAGVLGASLAGLPGGDRKALLVLGLVLGPTTILVAQAVSYLVTLAVFETVGRRRSLVGVPWFPLFSACLLGVLFVGPF